MVMMRDDICVLVEKKLIRFSGAENCGNCGVSRARNEESREEN